METLDRRGLIRGLAFATVAAAGGVGLMANAASAMPIDPRASVSSDMNAQKAQVVIVAPRHRHRRARWVCWWHRGRRVCGWR